MSSLNRSYDLELHVADALVLLSVAAAGVVLAVVGDLQPDPSLRIGVLVAALIYYAIAGIGWQLFRWQREHGAWFVVLASVATMGLGLRQPAIDGILTVAAVPVVMALALLGSRAAILVAVAETALLLASSATTAIAYSEIAIIPGLLSLWTVAVLTIALQRVMVQNARWSWESSQQMHQALESARERSARLEQTLDDLSHANRQLDLLNERLASARMLAEEAQKTKAEFVAKVSHEFRTPLNMIIGLTDLLLETPDIYGDALSPDLLMDLSIVHRNCDHLSSLVNDVLDLSQIEAGHLTLHREWVDLTEDIRSAMLVVQPLVAKKKLGLTVTVPESLPRVYCDHVRIRQVILNLLSNAARYTHEGRITVDVMVEEYAVVVRVQDTGPGLPQHEIGRIFEPFYQTDSAWDRDMMGSGLGLSISKQFIDRHNGNIWVESQLGTGSTFAFRLPICPHLPPTPRPARWLQEDWIWLERTSLEPIVKLPYRERVVVYDQTQKVYPFLCRDSGQVEVINHNHLDELLTDARACPPHAVVLVSINVSELWKQLRHLRRRLPDTPIIGYCVSNIVDRVAKFGVAGYLVKPITRAALDEATRLLNGAVDSVLIVDDNPDVLQLLTRMLLSLNSRLEVLYASSGKDALDRMRNDVPDLVLLDIVLPDMDGWNVLEHKNRDPQSHDIPVIILSAQDPNEQPLASEVLLATIGRGVSGDRLLGYALRLSSMLLKPDTELDLVLG